MSVEQPCTSQLLNSHMDSFNNTGTNVACDISYSAHPLYSCYKMMMMILLFGFV